MATINAIMDKVINGMIGVLSFIIFAFVVIKSELFTPAEAVKIIWTSFIVVVSLFLFIMSIKKSSKTGVSKIGKK